VSAPYGVKQYTEAAAAGARAAGWPQGTSLSPDSPVVIFGRIYGTSLSPDSPVVIFGMVYGEYGIGYQCILSVIKVPRMFRPEKL
jgi:hypothetical protein